MAKVTLQEIVHKWERQLHDLTQTRQGFEAHLKGTVVGSAEYDNQKEGLHRTEARIEMIQEHIRELREYALAHAR